MEGCPSDWGRAGLPEELALGREPRREKAGEGLPQVEVKALRSDQACFSQRTEGRSAWLWVGGRRGQGPLM